MIDLVKFLNNLWQPINYAPFREKVTLILIPNMVFVGYFLVQQHIYKNMNYLMSLFSSGTKLRPFLTASQLLFASCSINTLKFSTFVV